MEELTRSGGGVHIGTAPGVAGFGRGEDRNEPLDFAGLHEQHRVLQSAVATVHQSTPRIHGVGIRVGSKHADRHRLSRERKQLPGLRSGIRPWPAERLQ